MTDLIRAAKLWAKTSAKTGRPYLVGRWGGCRVLIFENSEEGERQPSHFLFIGDAEAGQERDPSRRPQARDGVSHVKSASADRTGGAHGHPPGDGPAKPSARPQERGDGWRGSQYRRPANGARRAPEADHAPFYEDDLADIGR